MNKCFQFSWLKRGFKYFVFWVVMNFALCLGWYLIYRSPIRHVSDEAARRWQEDLKGKVAIVTGSSSGIGRAIAKKAISLKMKVVLVDIDGSGLDSLVSESNLKEGDYLDVQQDLADISAPKRIVKDALGKFGRIDILFNNAGYGYIAGTERADLDQARKQFDVNFWAYVSFAKNVIPIMKKQNWGRIVNISSITGEDVSFLNYRAAFYVSSKQAVSAWSSSLQEELANSQISVMTVAPGGVATNFYKNMIGVDSDNFREKQKPLMVSFDSPDLIANEIFRSLPEEIPVLYPGQGRFLKTFLHVRCVFRGDCR